MNITINSQSFTNDNIDLINKFVNELDQVFQDLFQLYRLNKVDKFNNLKFDGRSNMMLNLSNYNLGVDTSLRFHLNIDYYKEIAVLGVYNFMDGTRTDIEIKFDEIEKVISSDEIFEYLNNYMFNTMNYVHTLEEQQDANVR